MKTQNRIQYIDAMRGFAMMVVVLHHVFSYSFKYYKAETVVSSFFITFMLPLFFFISGYIGYKAPERWNAGYFISYLKKKAYILWVPSLIFLFIYCTVIQRDFVSSFCDSGLCYYWFNEVLFEMFLVYFIIAFISNKFSNSLFNPLIIAVAIIAVFVLSFCFQTNAITKFLNLRGFCRYFQFFALGLLCNKYQDRFKVFITHQTVRSILIVLFFALFLFMWRGPFDHKSFIFKMNHDLVIRYAGLLLVVSLFVTHADYFEANGKISRALQYVGVRTLDVYLLHVFFIPKLYFFKPYFIKNDYPFVEFIIAVLLASIILALSLALSALIRHSDFLGHALFGAKSDKYKF
jgi:peptidoglycan/LPS O-acetylase OafA/YrhL